jgi:hypothetical protein
MGNGKKDSSLRSNDSLSEAVGINLRKFRTKKQELCGVEDPQQNEIDDAMCFNFAKPYWRVRSSHLTQSGWRIG